MTVGQGSDGAVTGARARWLTRQDHVSCGAADEGMRQPGEGLNDLLRGFMTIKCRYFGNSGHQDKTQNTIHKSVQRLEMNTGKFPLRQLYS